MSGIQTKPTCSYCQQSHASSECPTVTDVSSRREILKTSERCFTVYVGVTWRESVDLKATANATKRDITPGTYEANEINPIPPKLNPGATPFESTNATLCAGDMRTVLLQMARTQAYNPLDPSGVRII